MARIPLSHLALALLVVAIWGTNFVVIRIGLNHLPPLLFAGLRFALAALPALGLVRRPPVGWGSLAAYGLLIGAGQFGLLFIAMDGHISPGLASLVVQMQVFFTIGLSVWWMGEGIRTFQLVALVVAASGIAVIAVNTDGTTTPLGLGLVLLAALSWAGGNVVAKASGARNLLPVVVWGSLFSFPPLLLMSLLVEGWPAIRTGLASAGAATWGALLWQTIGNSLFGYAAWGWLLARHPAASIVPAALLVPVFGLAASALWLGEPLPVWKVASTGLVIGGLGLGVLYPFWTSRRIAAQGGPGVDDPPGPGVGLGDLNH
ncbi:Permease of the drug/metabolite transporter (DMT) superfamily [Rubellimicrobium mesophilum DSM 19309]|uniref:Permease of the drug/metabolite transporter (DMT) superfamily n=1 Tax=Rubellimicrobium mesophilum DSM 19309 TaxID=442562 RepID=A0A017HVJ2_9RHOB|nr:EamA family transporter [Rubellimicrobium mesophilum]EYD78345.1 Permease of the drug/metabolite transporter (DMT) superfamily [Rubellimicrobium mesophilum DSM 19309]